MDMEQLSAPPKLIVASPQGRGKLFVLTRNAMAIGRDVVNDLVLDSQMVSRRHAVLLSDGHFVTLRDLGSRNGTYLNGARVETAVLADRDIIEVADFLMRFLAFDQEVVSPDAMAMMAAQGRGLPHRGRATMTA